MIKSRDIPELIFDRLPVFSATWRLYAPDRIGLRPGSIPLLIALGIYAARLAANRDEESLVRVFRFVEEVHEVGTPKAVDLVVFFFLEVFAGGLNELGVDLFHAETQLGPRTRDSVELLRATNLWAEVRLSHDLSLPLR